MANTTTQENSRMDVLLLHKGNRGSGRVKLTTHLLVEPVVSQLYCMQSPFSQSQQSFVRFFVSFPPRPPAPTPELICSLPVSHIRNASYQQIVHIVYVHILILKDHNMDESQNKCYRVHLSKKTTWCIRQHSELEEASRALPCCMDSELLQINLTGENS